jgi:uncharacterized protein (TIGR03118 family)
MNASRTLAARLGWTATAAAMACTLAACHGDDDDSNEPPSMPYAVTNLVSDGAVAAAHTDPNLVNGWGVAFNPTGFVWVSAAGTSKSTLYDGNGVVQSLVVATPPGPTGIVFSGGSDFVVTRGAVSGPSRFIFAGEGGTLAGWSPAVNPNATVTAYDGGAAGKSYKGLALASQGGANFLYATDFHNGRIDMFDRTFTPFSTAGRFTDPALPAGYAPFGIQAVGDRIYVAYGRQDADAHDAVNGAGLGVIDVYDTAGALVRRLVTGGVLNAPWGMAMAPAGFGTFSNALLVGNFGDGRIHAFDPATGDLLGTLRQADGTPIEIDGLWGIAFGNGVNAQPTTTLFFAAGPADETHGLYGRIDLK